jgi:hypothetical protein
MTFDILRKWLGMMHMRRSVAIATRNSLGEAMPQGTKAAQMKERKRRAAGNEDNAEHIDATDDEAGDEEYVRDEDDDEAEVFITLAAFSGMAV